MRDLAVVLCRCGWPVRLVCRAFAAAVEPGLVAVSAASKSWPKFRLARRCGLVLPPMDGDLLVTRSDDDLWLRPGVSELDDALLGHLGSERSVEVDGSGLHRVPLGQTFDLVTAVELPPGARLVALEQRGYRHGPIDLSDLAVPTTGLRYGYMLWVVFEGSGSVVIRGRHARTRAVRDRLDRSVVWAPFGNRWLRSADGMSAIHDSRGPVPRPPTQHSNARPTDQWPRATA